MLILINPSQLKTVSAAFVGVYFFRENQILEF